MAKRDHSFKGFCFIFAAVAGSAMIADNVYKQDPVTVDKVAAPMIEEPTTYATQKVTVRINRSNGNDYKSDIKYSKEVQGTFDYPSVEIMIGGGWNLPAQDEICKIYQDETGKSVSETLECDSFYRLPSKEKAAYIADALVHGMSGTNLPKVFDPAFNNETTVPSKHVRYIVNGRGIPTSSNNFYYDQATPRYEATTSHLLNIGEGNNAWYRTSHFHFNEESDLEKTEFQFVNQMSEEAVQKMIADFNQAGTYKSRTYQPLPDQQATATVLTLSAARNEGQTSFERYYQRRPVTFNM